jgi:hypothetical protein
MLIVPAENFLRRNAAVRQLTNQRCFAPQIALRTAALRQIAIDT